VSFVGSEGRDWIKFSRYNLRLLEWSDPSQGQTSVQIGNNRGYSDYRALQIQYQRRLHRGLQALVSYTWGRSRDTVSNDITASAPTERIPPDTEFGYADYDVRHNLTAALTYNLPEFSTWRIPREVMNGWSLDMMLRARSGLPVNPGVNVPFPPETIGVRPNVIAGQPFWIEDSSVPGGRRLNRQAFSTPLPNTQGDLPRGVVRGFGASQVDLAVRREFALSQHARVQLRFEMFNLFNTANFDDPVTSLTSSMFGVSSRMLNRAFGSEGLNALYQMGGPRSSQIAVKLLF
jgi:hypothetical protein